MISSGKVRQRLKQVLFRHRKKYVEDGLKRRPCNCIHNADARVLDDKVPKQTVRLCLYQVEDRSKWNNVVCDESLGGVAQAERCPYYECKHSVKDLEALFNTVVGIDGTNAEFSKHYPDVAALLWVLGQDSQNEKNEEEDV